MGNISSNNSHSPAWAELNDPIDGVWYTIHFEVQDYRQGTCRYAFQGVYKGEGGKAGEKCVWKVFKKKEHRDKYNYESDIEMSQIADYYATIFNEEFHPKKKLKFLQPRLATVRQVLPNDYVKAGDQILVEDFIDGTYEKFNSNGGFENNAASTIRSFSHFTYDRTGGKLLICDIQGARYEDRYVLTDPAILSRTAGKFGQTDGGPNGMGLFFDSHTCTRICKGFLPPELNQSRRIKNRKRKPTAYTFELTDSEREANQFFRDRSDLPATQE